MLFVPWRPFPSFRQETQPPCTPSLVHMTHFVYLPPSSMLSTVLKFQARRRLEEKKTFMSHGNLLLVKQTSKRRKKHRAHQRIVPKEPSVGRALRGLAGLPLGSTVGLRCLSGRVSTDIV